MEDVEDIYELSPMQHGMLFDSVTGGDSGMYLIQLEYFLRGDLRVPELERAWQQTVDRHPILRTSFHWEGMQKPLQVVHRQVGLTLDRHDWSQLAADERDQRAASFREEDRRRGVDFEEAPLMRLALFREGPDAHRLLWSFHHILMEGWSAALVLRDVRAHYRSITQGQSPQLQEHRLYRDYVALLQQQDSGRTEEYWRGELRGFQSPTHLGIDGSPTSMQASVVQYDEQRLKLSAESTEVLRSFAQRHELTLNTVVQGAWAVLLSRYSGEEDVVLGTIVSGRSVPLQGIESMVGLFINLLPSRVRVSPGEPLVPWLRRLQSHQVRQREFEHSPLVQVKGWSEVPAGLPLFESLLVFENWLGDLTIDDWDTDLEVRDVRGYYGGAGHPLTAIVAPGPELGIGISYDQDRFEAASIVRMLANLEVLLCGMAADPERCLADLPFLAADERELQLSQWNATETSDARGGCLHELFEEQVRCTPDAVAAIFEDRSLSYGELDRRANQLAHHLRGLGVVPDVRVALYMERSLDAVVAILGILKAGGAYLPLDPDYPPDRLRYVAQDAAAAVVITHAATRERLPDFGAPTVVCLDRDADGLAARATTPLPPAADGSNLAYVLYTSGSTGLPKGVAMPHAPLVNLMHWQFAQSSCDAGSRTLQFAPFGFDVSCQEIFATLGSGGTLCLVGDETRRDPAALLELLHERAVNRIFVPFVALQQLAEALKSGATVPTALREVITAGEQPQMNAAMVELFRRLPGCPLVNQYGPTECHVVSSWTLSGEPAEWPTLPPIGRPIDNTTLYVVDSELRPVPIGVQGELLIGGACVARGYLHRATLTAERFVPDPFGGRSGGRPGERLYRTGDLARHLPDGSLQLLGRIDHQVKVRGFRVELGEIEVTLGHHPDLSEVAVVAREDTPGVKRLVAYLACLEESAPTSVELRNYLKERLPEYMVPTAFVRLDALPQTPSGKVDRRALPAPDSARPELEEDFLAPRNPLESQIAEIWQKVLGVDRVGVRDNFFDLGGHSLLLLSVIGELKKKLGVQVSPGELILPTLGQLASLCEERMRASEPAEPAGLMRKLYKAIRGSVSPGNRG